MNPFHAPNPEFECLMIFGAGGFGREVAWLSHQSWDDSVTACFVVDHAKYLVESVAGLPVRLLEDCSGLLNARYVIALGDPHQRRLASEACDGLGLTAATLVHPRVEASSSVVIGTGTIVCAGSILTVDVQIGAHVHINLGCTIGHDATVGNFSTLSPGVHVSGHVKIGNGVFIGTGATIINGRSDAPLVIGDGAMIAAGACVIASVEPNSLMAGVPALRKR